METENRSKAEWQMRSRKRLVRSLVLLSLLSPASWAQSGKATGSSPKEETKPIAEVYNPNAPTGTTLPAPPPQLEPQAQIAGLKLMNRVNAAKAQVAATTEGQILDAAVKELSAWIQGQEAKLSQGTLKCRLAWSEEQGFYPVCPEPKESRPVK